MNRLVYFHEELSITQALGEEGSDSEVLAQPEKVPHTVRTTMEELAYRTAVWYTPNGKPFLHYLMTTNGIQVRKIQDEDNQRRDSLERITLPGQEPRLLG